MRVKRTFTAVLGASAGSVRFESAAEFLPGSRFNVDVWPRVFEVVDGERVDVWITISASASTTTQVLQAGKVRVAV